VDERPRPAPPDLADNALYQDPRLRCDLVMKGGITSGITYPKAVCEIALAYRLRNVGGTSAGAIAAAAAAAAEVGRRRPGAGFGRLATLPERLSATPRGQRNSVMFNLFQPSDETRPMFRLLTGSLQSKGRPVRRLRKLFWGLVVAEPAAAAVGSAFGIAVVALVAALDRTQPDLRTHAVAVAAMALSGVAGLLLALVGTAGAAAAALLSHSGAALVANRFGICSGFAPGTTALPGTPDADDLQVGPKGKLAPKPLSTWLADEFDAMAGKTDPTEPLTLRDLAEHGVNLKMFTTNLTDGTAYTLPFRSRKFFFAPREFRELFPERIVKWMEDHIPAPRDAEEIDTFARMRQHNPPLLPFPDARDLPVVVMTRMSLSFPVLLSAVPLWALLWSEESEGVAPTQSWFSDGGITSNFPLHFFDSPLPRWPTFGVNLGPGENLDPDDQGKNIWAPRGNDQGVEARSSSITSLPGFLSAIADTMQNWMDNAQTRVPGYRDRIVLIKHTKDEGGLNLDMGPAQIDRLAERGRRAGQFLVNRFAHEPSLNPGDTMGWENHRWLRYRTLMPLVEGLTTSFVRGYDWVPEPDLARPYATLIQAPIAAAPSYRWCSAAQRSRAAALTDALIALGRDWGGLPDLVPMEVEPVDLSAVSAETQFDPGHPFSCRAPRPRPAIRIVRDF
jgi:predicted acylesterase/phospholipase RssA